MTIRGFVHAQILLAAGIPAAVEHYYTTGGRRGFGGEMTEVEYFALGETSAVYEDDDLVVPPDRLAEARALIEAGAGPLDAYLTARRDATLENERRDAAARGWRYA